MIIIILLNLWHLRRPMLLLFFIDANFHSFLLFVSHPLFALLVFQSTCMLLFVATRIIRGMVILDFTDHKIRAPPLINIVVLLIRSLL